MAGGTWSLCGRLASDCCVCLSGGPRLGPPRTPGWQNPFQSVSARGTSRSSAVGESSTILRAAGDQVVSEATQAGEVQVAAEWLALNWADSVVPCSQWLKIFIGCGGVKSPLSRLPRQAALPSGTVRFHSLPVCPAAALPPLSYRVGIPTAAAPARAPGPPPLAL
jgi:hypothetical protein